MTDEYDVKTIHDDPEPEAEVCRHEHGVMVCMDCDYIFPAPGPRGYEIFDGEWDDES